MHYNIDFHSYADDMQLCKALPNISETSMFAHGMECDTQLMHALYVVMAAW